MRGLVGLYRRRATSARRGVRAPPFASSASGLAAQAGDSLVALCLPSPGLGQVERGQGGERPLLPVRGGRLGLGLGPAPSNCPAGSGSGSLRPGAGPLLALPPFSAATDQASRPRTTPPIRAQCIFAHPAAHAFALFVFVERARRWPCGYGLPWGVAAPSGTSANGQRMPAALIGRGLGTPIKGYRKARHVRAPEIPGPVLRRSADFGGGSVADHHVRNLVGGTRAGRRRGCPIRGLRRHRGR